MTQEEEKSMDSEGATKAHFTGEAAPDEKAWEEVAAGRYMPRRTRGSCKGRALG